MNEAQSKIPAAIGPTIFANDAMLTQFGDPDRKALRLAITVNAC
jgi:hypothetical protein